MARAARPRWHRDFICGGLSRTAKEEGLPNPDGSRTPLLLVVIDEPEAALALGSTLSHFGYSLIFSRTIDDAIGMARARQPHLVVSAFEIGGRPAGVQLAHGLHQHLPGMPILLLCDDESRAHHAIGNVPHVKPLTGTAPATDLLLAISNLLQLQPHG